MSNYKSTETNELFAALSMAQSEINVAQRDSNNPFFKSKYANLQAVIEASRPALCKNGLSVIQTMQPDGNDQYLVTVLGHKSGQWISSMMKINPAKPDVQSLGSYITYLRRYCYGAITGVYDGEDDDGNHASQPTKSVDQSQTKTITNDQLAKLVDMIQIDITVYEKIQTRYRVSELTELNFSQAEDAIKFLTPKNK